MGDTTRKRVDPAVLEETPIPPDPKPRKIWESNREEVYLFNDPTKIAYVLHRGPYQSEIKFPNGNVRLVSNSWIKPVEE